MKKESIYKFLSVCSDIVTSIFTFFYFISIFCNINHIFEYNTISHGKIDEPALIFLVLRVIIEISLIIWFLKKFYPIAFKQSTLRKHFLFVGFIVLIWILSTITYDLFLHLSYYLGNANQLY